MAPANTGGGVSDSTVRVAVLLPEVLGTYSDAGNAVVLAQRLRWRGIDAEIVTVSASDEPPTGCEVYLLGGGEDTAQYFAARWLARHRRLRGAMESSAVTLAVCAGLQLLGQVMVDREGREHAGAGLLDVATRPGRTRAVGETLARCRIPGVGTMTGFCNHGGISTLGPGTAALGAVVHGPGNDPVGGLEGALHPDVALDPPTPPGGDIGSRPGVVATYLHGPVLARNPDLADHLLARVVGHPLPTLTPARLPELPDLRATYLPDQQQRRP